MLTLLAKLFIALNSENSPKQISYAIALGMIIGLTPMLSLHNLVVLLLAFLVRVHLGAFFVGWTVFSILGLLFAPLFASLGHYLLTMPSLAGMWDALYQSTFMRLAHFHHTSTLGSLVVCLILFFPLVFLLNYLIAEYRTHIMTYVLKFRIVQTLKASKIYKLYNQLQGA
ncbi:TIGR03546 family protein [Catenovulum sp. 2E275]|uniref:TIGR03546 family protein n=1 Tax=Catenovulum sp. 2E275 TaxID=2980497 RepID=UPI0021D3067A|nr:TIGR03546 family protein [Catenovulum sp. 2E275]MCU4674245.1 TIGR03546 family protein [Catenovulum sp. 2E275]